MNQRLLLALAILGPTLAGADALHQTASTPPAATAATPAASDGAQMYAYLVTDGKQSKYSLFAPEAAPTPIAKVDDEVVRLEELSDALFDAHRDRRDGAARDHDFKPVLDRILDMKLMAAEAREMGLDELPAVKQAIEAEQESQLIQRVRGGATREVKPDPKVEERFYQDAVREWKLRSLLFAKGEDAKAFTTQLKAKKDFAEIGKKAVAEKKATGTTEATFVGPGAMLPQVLTAVARLKVGSYDVVKVNDGWAVVQVVGVRYPENAQARAQAKAKALEAARQKAAIRLYEELAARYAKTDKKLLKRVDFEAKKPGFAALRKDKRVLARIAGEEPLTVGDLAAGLEQKFFHGMDDPIKQHRANPAKEEVFHTLLRRRLVLQEARRHKLADRADFKRYMDRFTEATLFSAYLERVVMPSVKVSEQEGEKYYAEHKADFTVPAMYRLDSIVFEKAKDAESAFQKLRAGTDFKWMRANATGQVKEDKRVAQLDGTVVSANALPPALKAQLAGAKLGDFRMQEIEGQFFVVRVASMTPGSEQPFAQVREAIGKKLIAQNLNKAIREAGEKLRGTHQVAIYVARIGF